MAFAIRYSTLVIFSALAVASSYAAPLGTSFTYQGYLENGSGPVTDTCDFEFALYEDASGTMQVGTTQPVAGVAVTGGVFTVGPPNLDFGEGAFNGEARWLKVSVCCPATCTPVALSPLVELTPAPYALHTRGLLVDGEGLHVDGNVLAGDPVVGFDDPGGMSPDNYMVVGSTDLNQSVGLNLAVMDGVQNSRVWMTLDTAAKRLDLTHGWSTLGDLDYYISRNKLALLQGGTDGERVMTIGGPGNNVGIGTPTPAAKLDVASATQDTTVHAENTATSGVKYGGYFESHSPDGYGVFGLSDGAGSGAGVYGKTMANGLAAFGVKGEGIGGSYGGLGWGYNDIGVYGLSPSTSGYGVFGIATATSGPNYGVWGQTHSSNGYGVYGLASDSGGGSSSGVYGRSNALYGYGVQGHASDSSGINYGVYGKSDSPEGFGVYGANFAGGYGVYSFGKMHVTSDLSCQGSVGIGTTMPDVKLHVVGGTDAEPESGGYIVAGSTTSTNISIDNNEIMARNNGATSELFLNADGGDVILIQGGTGNVGIGTSSPAAKLHVAGRAIIDDEVSTEHGTFCRSSTALGWVVGIGRPNDGTLIEFWKPCGVPVGSITLTGSTVSYNAFTGSHFGWTDENLQRGTLVVLTGGDRRRDDDPGSEPVYGIAPSTAINDSKCLGAYLGILNPHRPPSLDNPHQVMAVGNGDMWVVDTGRNIEPGHYLISSDVSGHAMLDDDSRFPVGYVIARAAESVEWSDVSDTIDGRKHKRISVFFESFERGCVKVAALEAEVTSLRTRLAAMEAVVARLAAPMTPGDAVLAKRGNEHD